ncbi:MAG: PorP/SprF family type IX secretion system membrane protein [Bacteroidota bacterium]
MMKKALFIFFFLSLLIDAQGQDRLFSQFYASPLTLNPALTGAFEGKYRVSAIYRDQWEPVMEDSYSTFSTALDLRWRVGEVKSKYKDYAAVGVMFYNDKAGLLELSTTSILISGAFHKALDLKSTQYISLGFQAGVAQKNVNYADVTFEDQFNGTTGFSNPTNERLPDNNFAIGDYSVGLNYVFSPQYSKMRFFVGGAMHHFNEPSISFYHNDNPETDLPDNKLDARYSGQVSAFLPVSDGIQLQPRMIIDKQGNHLKMDAGMNIRFDASEYKNIAIHLGGYLRPVQDYDESTRLDALVTLLGVEFNNVLIGMSYDLNLGELSDFNRRTFEFSVAYLGEYEDDVILCPKF